MVVVVVGSWCSRFTVKCNTLTHNLPLIIDILRNRRLFPFAIGRVGSLEIASFRKVMGHPCNLSRRELRGVCEEHFCLSNILSQHASVSS